MGADQEFALLARDGENAGAIGGMGERRKFRHAKDWESGGVERKAAICGDLADGQARCGVVALARQRRQRRHLRLVVNIARPLRGERLSLFNQAGVIEQSDYAHALMALIASRDMPGSAQ